jgi:hypothetical protein
VGRFYDGLRAARWRAERFLGLLAARGSGCATYARMPTARHGLGAATVAGRIYVISGGPSPGASAGVNAGVCSLAAHGTPLSTWKSQTTTRPFRLIF